MAFYPHRNPRWLTRLISMVRLGFWWHGPETKNTIYITFDDGPIPEVTPFVLAQLAAFGAKATFFCLGKNVDQNPDLFHQIVAEGHSIGSHTYNHPNGRKADDKTYHQEVEIGQAAQDRLVARSNAPLLFRPPYGRLRSSQAKWLKSNGYQIVLWEVLSGDFDLTLSPADCAANTCKAIKPGSIIVFHDSLKAKDRLEVALPAVLAYAKKKGWSMVGL